MQLATTLGRGSWCTYSRMMWAIHVRNAVTSRNLVASILALNVREARHFATTSSVILHMLICMRICSYESSQHASTHWRPAQGRKQTTMRFLGSSNIREVVRTHASMKYMRSNAAALVLCRCVKERIRTPNASAETSRPKDVETQRISLQASFQKRESACAHMRKNIRLVFRLTCEPASE